MGEASLGTRGLEPFKDVPTHGRDFEFPTYVAPITPGQLDVGRGHGSATAEHRHPFWLYEYSGAISDAALVATGDFTQDDLDAAEGTLLFFRTDTNNLVARKSSGTYVVF